MAIYLVLSDVRAQVRPFRWLWLRKNHSGPRTQPDPFNNRSWSCCDQSLPSIQALLYLRPFSLLNLDTDAVGQADSDEIRILLVSNSWQNQMLNENLYKVLNRMIYSEIDVRNYFWYVFGRNETCSSHAWQARPFRNRIWTYLTRIDLPERLLFFCSEDLWKLTSLAISLWQMPPKMPINILDHYYQK